MNSSDIVMFLRRTLSPSPSHLAESREGSLIALIFWGNTLRKSNPQTEIILSLPLPLRHRWVRSNETLMYDTVGDRNVRMYNPTHRFCTSAETAPTGAPIIARSREIHTIVHDIISPVRAKSHM